MKHDFSCVKFNEFKIFHNFRDNVFVRNVVKVVSNIAEKVKTVALIKKI